MWTIKIIILLIMISMSHQQKHYTEDEQRCGPYGFRCVDTDSYQICTYPDSDGITDAPEIIRKCNDRNSVCDEDNLAYCTPLDPMVNDIKQKCRENSQKNVLAKRGQSENFSKKSNEHVKSRNTFDLDDDDVTGTITTTIPGNEFDDSSIQNNMFDCEHYGFYPDNENTSMFWFCDYHNNGHGFTVRHMLCSPGRIFHPVHKECVLIGTTRDTRSGQHNSFREEQKSTKTKGSKVDFGVKFSCKNHIPGKYPDRINCRMYHYCLPLTFAPFIRLSFICPDHLTYDDKRGTCNSISSHRCIEWDIKGNGQLHIEIDAILLQKEKCKRNLCYHDPTDCRSYHLCYNSEMVHLKCPNSYNFDQNLLICQPQHLVSCYET